MLVPDMAGQDILAHNDPVPAGPVALVKHAQDSIPQRIGQRGFGETNCGKGRLNGNRVRRISLDDLRDLLGRHQAAGRIPLAIPAAGRRPAHPGIQAGLEILLKEIAKPKHQLIVAKRPGDVPVGLRPKRIQQKRIGIGLGDRASRRRCRQGGNHLVDQGILKFA